MKRGNRVIQITVDSNFICVWETAKQAEEYLEIRHVSEVCRGKGKTEGGFKWMYKDIVKA